MDKQEAWNAVRYLKDVDDLYPPTGREVLALARAVCDVNDRLTALDSASTRDPLEEYAEDMGAVDEPDHTCETCGSYGGSPEPHCTMGVAQPCGVWTPRETPKAQPDNRAEHMRVHRMRLAEARELLKVIAVRIRAALPLGAQLAAIDRFLGEEE